MTFSAQGAPPPVVEIKPDDRRYADLQMRGYNRRFVGTPDSVYLVSDTQQVVDVVNQAVRDGKRIAVRSGGHCAEGLIDDPAVEAVIDLSMMDGVGYDADMRAFVVQGGVKLGRLYEVLDMGWGVTLPGGSCPGVGVGGHVTGGGNGVLSRQYGTISDYLYAIEIVVVDADGNANVVVATREQDDEHRDLWWAHAGGGGGNFGIVTRFWFRDPAARGDDPASILPPSPTAYTQVTAVWQWDALDESLFALLVKNFMSWSERNAAPGLPTAVVHGEMAALRKEGGAVMLMGWLDPSAEGSGDLLEAYLAEVTDGLPEPMMIRQENEPWLYRVLNIPDEAAAVGLDAARLRTKIKSAYLRAPLDDDQVSTLHRHLTQPGYEHHAAGVMLATWGGRINEVGPTQTAITQRDSIVLMSFISSWNESADDDKHLAWVRAFYADVFSATGGVPVSNDQTAGCYINWPDTDISDPRFNKSGVHWSALFYGDNYTKLQKVKSRWDPNGIFRHALSIEGI
ncbi:FAD-binding oxidoreductase [Kibdelosporangium aridum]|uniref:FAD-binding oxidoreductase n=1 Tax=Kibdelosporangium aridum TaxID=2030 RepID=UPI0035E78C20